MDKKKLQDEEQQPVIHGVYPRIPDHSDLRGFSYRGPVSEDTSEQELEDEAAHRPRPVDIADSQSQPSDEEAIRSQMDEAARSTNPARALWNQAKQRREQDRDDSQNQKRVANE